jgi:hypothetical protein
MEYHRKLLQAASLAGIAAGVQQMSVPAPEAVDACASDPLSSATIILFTLASVFLVVFTGICAGLTLGLLSLKRVDLEVIKRSGEPSKVWLVKRVEPVSSRFGPILIYTFSF